MTQKTAFVLSAILTAFVLVVGGGVIARVSQADAVPAQAAVAPVPPVPAVAAQTADVMAQAQALLQQRDAEYRKLIDQANQRLAAMNQQQAAAQAAQAVPAAQPAAPQPPASAPVAAPQIAISSEAALFTAVAAANNATMIRTPELVRFEGKVAYEIGFTKGVVYIDANTGAVLFNGTQGRGGGAQPSSQPSAPGGEHEDDHEHEGEHESEREG
jgi:uncharacterized membrane protein YkoI